MDETLQATAASAQESAAAVVEMSSQAEAVEHVVAQLTTIVGGEAKSAKLPTIDSARHIRRYLGATPSGEKQR
jgi:hypothetical protein